MNAEEFLQEALSSEDCPDNFESIYRRFREYQADALRTLQEFHRVCMKNGIEYQLAFGSLLGAVRDDGQIPWDYDVDVLVLYEDKSKLIEALKADLSEDYYYYCPESDPKCRHVIMRLAPKEYKTEALHVDVFYLVGTPNDEAKRNKYMKQVKKQVRMRFGKHVKIREEAAGKFIRYLYLLYRKVPTLFISADSIQEKFEALCQKYPIKSSEYCIVANSFADRNIFPSRTMKETMMISTAAGNFFVPVNYDEVLSMIYGEYKTIPPIQNRIKEVLHSYNRIKFFEKG